MIHGLFENILNLLILFILHARDHIVWASFQLAERERDP